MNKLNKNTFPIIDQTCSATWGQIGDKRINWISIYRIIKFQLTFSKALNCMYLSLAA